jgi:hypothetical protein
LPGVEFWGGSILAAALSFADTFSAMLAGIASLRQNLRPAGWCCLAGLEKA